MVELLTTIEVTKSKVKISIQFRLSIYECKKKYYRFGQTFVGKNTAINSKRVFTSQIFNKLTFYTQ